MVTTTATVSCPCMSSVAQLLVSYLAPPAGWHPTCLGHSGLVGERLWPKVKIVFRGDSGLTVTACWTSDRHEVGYVVGIAKKACWNR